MKKQPAETSMASQVVDRMNAVRAKKSPVVKPFNGMSSTPVKGSSPFAKKAC